MPASLIVSYFSLIGVSLSYGACIFELGCLYLLVRVLLSVQTLTGLCLHCTFAFRASDCFRFSSCIFVCAGMNTCLDSSSVKHLFGLS